MVCLLLREHQTKAAEIKKGGRGVDQSHQAAVSRRPSSDEGSFLRPNLRSERESRNYTVSHMQHHSCHPLRVLVVVMSRRFPYVRWCELAASFDFLKCCGTGIRKPKRPGVPIRSFHKIISRVMRRSQGRHTQADTRVSAKERFGTQGQPSTKETTHWNLTHDEHASTR